MTTALRGFCRIIAEVMLGSMKDLVHPSLCLFAEKNDITQLIQDAEEFIRFEEDKDDGGDKERNCADSIHKYQYSAQAT